MRAAGEPLKLDLTRDAHRQRPAGSLAKAPRLSRAVRALLMVGPEGPMLTLKEAAAEFLAHRRIAVTGVSRNPQNHGGNVVYGR